MDGPQWTSVDLNGSMDGPQWTSVDLNGSMDGPQWTSMDLIHQKYPNVGANNHPEDLIRQKYPIVGRDTAFCRHGVGSPPTVEVGQPQWDDRPLPRGEAKGDASRNPKAGGKPT